MQVYPPSNCQEMCIQRLNLGAMYWVCIVIIWKQHCYHLCIQGEFKINKFCLENAEGFSIRLYHLRINENNSLITMKIHYLYKV